MYYSVAETARRLSVSAHTIRFYAREGLLDFVERDEHGNRRFQERDFHRLFIIASLKRSGMSIRQIRAFIRLTEQGEVSVPERLRMLREQKETVEERITELQDALDVLKYKIWLYSKNEADREAADAAPGRADMPPHIQRIKERIRRLTEDMEAQYQ